MTDSVSSSAACEWCGRAVARNDEGRWYAVKGDERGYDPMACEASDDGRHSPDQPATAALRGRCDECERGNHGICERPGSCVCTCWEVTVNDYPVA